VALISYAKRLTDLADAEPDRLSIRCGDDALTRRQLDQAANRLARDLAASGVGVGDMVTVALPNSVDWFVALAASWKIGAIPQPVSAALPRRELEAIIELAGSKVVIGADADAFADRRCTPVGYKPSPDIDDSPLPDAVSPAWKAPTSGGSTGRPKLIVAGDPSLVDDEMAPALFPAESTLVMPGPLYHNGPIVWSCGALLSGGSVVVLPRFDAETTLQMVETYKADVIYLVPTMMKRIWRLPEETRLKYDLSSLKLIWHLAEPCPPWLKEEWINWLGPDRIVELYAGTEGQAATVISGAEWLTHRGSVGRLISGELMICDPDGNEVPAGTEGEVWLRTKSERPTYRYVGAEARTREGGWESLGDMGWVDEEGYLYLGDRRQDMILSGGANIYPAEIEAALQEHPGVRSCVVIGLPDEDMGNRIHAIVEADPAATTEADIKAFLGERLVRYKVPRSFEFVDQPLRDDAGKVRRAALRQDRLDAPA
jgi:bile acid-coenzyme A ligase